LYINGALDIFENVSVLRYAEDLKDLFMTRWGSLAVLKGSRPFWASGAAVINLI
jgi:hypothetical protein